MDFVDLFPPSLRPYVSEIPENVLYPVNVFLCQLTGTFVYTLEDFWGTTALELFNPTFLVVFAWLSVQATTSRTGGNFFLKLFIGSAPLILLIGQILTIAATFNAFVAPAFVLLESNSRVKDIPSPSRLRAIAFATFFLYISITFLFGYPLAHTLWSISFFQFSPVIAAFFIYFPLSLLPTLFYTSAFDSNDKATSLRRFWYFVGGLAAILHVAAASRLVHALFDYPNAVAFGLPRTDPLAPLVFPQTLFDIFTVRQISDIGRVSLTLDYLVTASALILFMIFRTGAAKGSRGIFFHLPQIITLGPGAAFSFWMADNAEVPVKSD